MGVPYARGTHVRDSEEVLEVLLRPLNLDGVALHPQLQRLCVLALVWSSGFRVKGSVFQASDLGFKV